MDDWALYFILETSNFKLTRNSELGTRNSEPETRNSKLGTRNPEPETRNYMSINLTEIDQIVEDIGRSTADVIPILHAIQKKYKYLPEEALFRVCEISDITPAAISWVVFY